MSTEKLPRETADFSEVLWLPAQNPVLQQMAEVSKGDELTNRASKAAIRMDDQHRRPILKTLQLFFIFKNTLHKAKWAKRS